MMSELDTPYTNRNSHIYTICIIVGLIISNCIVYIIVSSNKEIAHLQDRLTRTEAIIVEFEYNKQQLAIAHTNIELIKKDYEIVVEKLNECKTGSQRETGNAKQNSKP